MYYVGEERSKRFMETFEKIVEKKLSQEKS